MGSHAEVRVSLAEEPAPAAGFHSFIQASSRTDGTAHEAGVSFAEGSAPVAGFHSFMQRYSRTYVQGSQEYGERLTLFSRRSVEVEAHNARPGRLWTAGINELSDRTEQELAALRGWRGAAARSPGAGGRHSASFLSKRRATVALPEEFMNWTSLKAAKRIVDQGGCGSCWAVTTAKVLEMHQEIYGGGSTPCTSSAQELLTCVQNPHNCGGTGGCDGATVELALHYIQNGLSQHNALSSLSSQAGGSTCKNSGILTQVNGYHNGGGSDSAEETLESLTRPGVHMAAPGAPGLNCGMLGWARLEENAYEPLLQTVYERGPVGVSVAAMDWGSYMSGVFDGCKGENVIDHAVVLVGYGKDKPTGALYYLIQNSWGAGWGEDGHIRLLRRKNDEERCAMDHQPELGTGCDGGPAEVKVCGMCGILYDSSVPYFRA